MHDDNSLLDDGSAATEDHRFFGGNDHALKTVRALPHLTFKSMVDQLLNVAIPINLTKAEFLAMPKAVRDQRKRVPYLIPCCMAQKSSRRATEHATHFNLICLDLDEEADGSCPAAPYVNNPYTLVEQLMPFNFAVYHTSNSTSKKPRIRIMVEADAIPVKKYKAAVDYLARLIGLVNVTKESYVCVQPMYLPTIFKGQAEMGEHPLIVDVTDGRAVTLNDIQSVEQTHGQSKKNRKGSEDYTTGDVLDYLRPVVDEIQLEHVIDALSSMDPDMPYMDWLEVAAAMRHQFPRDKSEDAYLAFDEWSKGGSKYNGVDDTRAKWDSLRPNPVNRVPVTIRTLFNKAIAAGWDGNKAKERCFHATRQWIAAHERTSTTLMTEGLGKIIATPMISQSGEEALLNMIAEECRKRWAIKVSLTSLRKDLANLRLEMKEKNTKVKQVAPPWTKGICYVASVDEFYRHATQERFSPGALDRYYSAKLMPSEEQLKAAGQQGDFGAAGKPTIKPQDYLLNQLGIPKVYDYVYDPRFPNDTFLHDGPRPYVNLYVQNHPEPDKETSVRAGKLLLKHLRNLIEEEDYRRTLIDFLAYIVQFPGKKIRWAVLIQGIDGCGKTLIAGAMDAVLGNGHVRVVDNNSVSSQWNDWSYGHQLVTIEEIRVVGHNRYDIMNVLKPLITNPMVNINQRNRDSRQVDNTANYLLFTNHHDALALTKGDRRYFILKSRMQTKEQVEELGENYFNEIFNMMQNYPGGLRHFLENWPISQDFNADGHAPRTKYMLEMLEESGHEAAILIKDAIADGQHPLISEDVVSVRSVLDWIATSENYSGRDISKKAISVILREEGYRPLGRAKHAGAIHYIWTRINSAASKMNVTKLVKERMEIFSHVNPDDWSLLE